MHTKLIRLQGGIVCENGLMTNHRGEVLGLRVSPGGYLIYDDADEIVGTLTLVGRVYTCEGTLVTQVQRYDMITPDPDIADLEHVLAREVGGSR